MPGQKKNRSEALAESYLKQLGFQTVESHPHGRNKTPDFLCDNRIAVEVRKLNLMKGLPDGEYEGLENMAIWLDNTHKMLSKFGEPVDGHSWNISYCFERPGIVDKDDQKKWFSDLKEDIYRALKQFRDAEERKPTTIWLRTDPQFDLIISKAGNVINNQMFILKNYKDKDRGGWLTHETILNIKRSIEIKSSDALKRPKGNPYPTWWLVLVDHTSSLKLEEYEKEVLRQEINYDRNLWEKVVILDCHDGSCKMIL